MTARVPRLLVALLAIIGLYYAALFFRPAAAALSGAGSDAAFPRRVRGARASRASGWPRRLLVPLAELRLPRSFTLIIFAHGNGELAEWWIDQFAEPRSWGFGVLLLEYPGYGGSAGAPSERSIIAAVLAAHDWARSDPRIDPARIIGYGRSLGGGVVTGLSAQRKLAALILESSFTSVRAYAAGFLAPGFLVRDPFDNLEHLAAFRGPLLVLHGERDEIAPVAHGRKLAAAVPGAELQLLPCGHNDCPRPWPQIRAFLERRGLMP